MLRRRAIMNIQAPDYDWDVAWDYTMGLPEENGFEKLVQGTPIITLMDDGVNIENRQKYYVRYSPTDYVRYSPTEIELQTCNEGILDVEVAFQTIPNANGVVLGFRMILSDGEEGCQISTNLYPDPAIMYDNNAQLQKIKDINYNVDYVFRIERISQLNKIYINNELVHQSKIPSRSYTAGNRVFFQGYPLKAVLKSIKFKKIS